MDKKIAAAVLKAQQYSSQVSPAAGAAPVVATAAAAAAPKPMPPVPQVVTQPPAGPAPNFDGTFPYQD